MNVDLVRIVEAWAFEVGSDTAHVMARQALIRDLSYNGSDWDLWRAFVVRDWMDARNRKWEVKHGQ